MIISLRGTHGSGKSTVVRTILERYPHVPLGTGKKPDGYRVSILFLRQPLFIVGPYLTACGGCDAIQPYDLIWPRIDSWSQQGHVLFEGALVSSSYGNIGRASEKFGDHVIFAFLDTPLEECIRRIKARRESRGSTKEFNPKNTISKYNSVKGSIDRIRGFKRRVVSVNYLKAIPQILGLFLKGEREHELRS